MQILTILAVFGSLSVLSYEVKCQLEIEELLQAQQRLNGGGGGGESGSGGMGRMIANSVRSSFVNTALNQAVKFVVGNTATPSPEMIQYGMTMRSGPRNQAERDVYLGLMKTIARRTPEVLMKYLKTDVQKNGTISYSLDFVALDADITRRSLLYQEMRASRRREQQRQTEQNLQHRTEVERLNMLREIRNERLFGSGITSGAYQFDSFGPTTPMISINTQGSFGTQTTNPTPHNIGSVGENGGAAEHQKKPTNQPKVDQVAYNVGTGTISLLDLLRNQQNSG